MIHAPAIAHSRHQPLDLLSRSSGSDTCSGPTKSAGSNASHGGAEGWQHLQMIVAASVGGFNVFQMLVYCSNSIDLIIYVSIDHPTVSWYLLASSFKSPWACRLLSVFSTIAAVQYCQSHVAWHSAGSINLCCSPFFVSVHA